MKIVVAYLIVSSFCSVVFAENPPSGIYAFAESGNGASVARNDTGQEIVLTERLAANLGEATMISVANDNSRYRLDLAGAGPLADSDEHQLVILAAGVPLVAFSRSDADAAGRISLSAMVTGREVADKIAAELEIEPRRREHPGHRLLVSWRAEQPSYQPKTPVTLSMSIKNVGSTKVAFIDGGSQRGPRNNQFDFIARAGSGQGAALRDVGDPTNFGGMGSLRSLAPGETFTKSVLLTDWFKFDEPGYYRITGLYRITLYEPGNFSRALWDDLASGECAVRIADGR